MLPILEAIEQAPTAVFLSTVGQSSAVKAQTKEYAVVTANFPIISSAIARENRSTGEKTLQTIENDCT